MKTLFALTLLLTPLHAQQGSYTTSWFGNSFGAGDQAKYIQGHIHDLFVSPEGRAYATTWWDEDCREQCAYENGEQVIWFPPFGHSNGRAVTANEKYVFFGYRGFGEKKDAQIRRFDRTKPLETRRDPRNPAKHYPMAGEYEIKTHDIRGLAIVGNELFATIERENTILVFDVESMKETRRIEFTAPGKLVSTPAGKLWIIRNMERFGDADPVLVEITPDGKPTGRSITGLVNPRALAIHSTTGRLLVGENGPRNQVIIFEISGTAAPKESGTFGESILAAPAGKVTPIRFDGITGIGSDKKGNIYISSDGNLSGRAASDGSGTVLRSLTPKGELNWEVLGLEFLENVGVDRENDAQDIFTLFHHYRMDYTKPPGKEWTRVSYTLDRFRYPQDARITGKHHQTFGFARIEGKPFMFVTAQWPGNINIYRFDGHIAVPAVRLTGIHEKDYPYPEGAPRDESLGKRFGSIWRDTNADGQMAPAEFTPTKMSWHWGRYIDPTSGDVWSGAVGIISRFKCEGLDAKGIPIYTPKGIQTFPLPAPFTDIRRLSYDAATDSLYLLGTTAKYPREKQFKDDRSAGRVLARVDKFTTDSPQLAWLIPITQGDGGPLIGGAQHTQAGSAEMPQGLAHGGDYVIVGAVNPAYLYAFEKKTGKHIQTFKPGPEVGEISGWLDVPFPFNIHQRANGEYLIFAEEGARHKVLMYRWKP